MAHEVREATQVLDRESLELLRRFPKHAKVLKTLGLDDLPDDSIIVVGGTRIQILIPERASLKLS